MRKLLIILIISIISGCGFHLKGAFTFPMHMQTLYISPDDPYEPLQKNVRRALTANNVQIIPSPQKEVAILELTEPQFTEAVAALNSYGQTQQIRSTITFQYKIIYKGAVLRPATIIRLSRDCITDPNSVLSSDSEQRVIREELSQEATNQLLRQLSTIPECD